jgi:hypothetical protein
MLHLHYVKSNVFVIYILIYYITYITNITIFYNSKKFYVLNVYIVNALYNTEKL